MARITIEVDASEGRSAHVERVEVREGLAPRTVPIAEVTPGNSITVQTMRDQEISIREIPLLDSEGNVIEVVPVPDPSGEGDDTIGDGA